MSYTGVLIESRPTSMPQTEENILLTKVVYDINSATPTQTFPVPREFVDLGISTRITTFRVLSNWGGDVTCIYRVSVELPSVPSFNENPFVPN